MFLLFLSFLSSLLLIFFMGKRLENIIVNYSTVEVERVASVILNDVIKEEFDAIDEKIFDIIEDDDGNIEFINFDSKVVNNLLNNVNDNALARLNAIEEGDTRDLVLSSSLKGTRLTFLDNGVVCEIPLGVLYNNALFVNLTTSVPIRFSFIGTVDSELVTDVVSYGVNNALIKVGIEVTIKEKITMPHSSKSVPLKTTINLATQVVQGQVPIYYNNSNLNDSFS